MRTSVRGAVVCVVMVVWLSLSASAFAAGPWMSNGAGNYSANGGAVAKFQIAGAAASIVCTGARISGGFNGPVGPGAGSWQVANLTPTFTGCRAGGIVANITCSAATLTANAYNGVTTVVDAQINNYACTVTVPAIAGCTVNITSTGPALAGVGNLAMFASYTDNRGILRTLNPAMGANVQTMDGAWANCGALFGAARGNGATQFGTNAAPPGDYDYTMVAGAGLLIPNITF